jgi:hypothetical protein
MPSTRRTSHQTQRSGTELPSCAKRMPDLLRWEPYPRLIGLSPHYRALPLSPNQCEQLETV